jgi:hypothetical protein
MAWSSPPLTISTPQERPSLIPVLVPVPVPVLPRTGTGAGALLLEREGEWALALQLLDGVPLDGGSKCPRSAGLSIIERVLAPMACAV